ncbi:hypothetical protein PR048_031939 [Dryococelus australis]|uniref:Uncharacterized protein n=1 Tax=Dryococelus australis TaxID=614101 RepID=A0ABQ9G6P8_9NEOP|nr:hypothetical protein PR048_031939 [Dryococelus australis]
MPSDDGILQRISNTHHLWMTLYVWMETINENIFFLQITVHFLQGLLENSKTNQTVEYLSDVFVYILNNWEIPLANITPTVTDNGANMVAAIRKTVGESKHLQCFAHTINLIVECSLNIPSIKGPITKVRDIVKWVKNSEINSDKHRKIQTDREVPEG